MTTEYFKVRNGLTVGEDAFTADATTGDVIVTGTLNVASNVIIDGNITINGDSTTLNTTELAVEDNKITLNKNVSGAPTLNSGIVVERGTSTDSELTWNESTDKWEQNRGGVATVIPISTTELAEGTNQYFTTQRAVDAVEAAGYATETQLSAKLNTADFTSTADSWLGGKSTSNLTEGTNKYYTDARVRTEINAGNPGSFVGLTAGGVVELLTDTVVVGDDTVTGYQGLEFNTLGKTAHLVIDNTTGKLIYSRDSVTWTPVPQSTAELAENTNLYYTDARVGSYLVSNSYATQGYVSTQVANLVASAPATLDTLNELAAALGNDANFATTITTALGTKLATADFTSTANTWLATKTTSNLAEGTNLYYTTARANTDFDTRLAVKSTDNLSEGSTNKYFSNTLARGAISGGTGVGYDSGTGVISIGQAVGTGNSPAFAGITAGNLTVGVATDNSIVSTDTNGNITLAPNGTGSVTNTFSNGGNLTNNRNYVAGAIRNSTTASIGDIWAVNSTGPSGPYRGISLDNSADTTKGPGEVLRSFSGGAVSGSATRGRYIFEKARGTSATPTAVQSGDFLGSVDATGYTSTGWVNDNVVAAVPASTIFAATENWVSNTNLGTGYSILLAPTATTISSSTNLISVASLNPQTNAFRSDATTFAQGKSGSTTYASLGLTGNTITALNASNIFIRQGTGTNTVPGLILRYSRTDQTGSSDLDGVDFRLSTGGTTTNNSISRIESQYRTSGLHEFGITVSSDNFATDADTIYFAKADKTIIRTTPAGTTGTVSDTFTITQAATTLQSDSLILKNAAGVNLVGSSAITYNRVYGQWQYDATLTPAAANTAYAVPFQGTNAVTDFANIASTASTSRVIPGAAGMFKLQFSAQVQNTDNADQEITFWWRKNGTDISASAGYVSVPKAAVSGTPTIVGWDNMVQTSNATDYFELMYAVTNTNITLPYIAAASPRPAAAAVFLTLIPVGA